jgi:ankyrin repeat protein
LDINFDLDWLGTFLILAVQRNNQYQVNFCLKHGADPNLGTYARRWSALATAAEYGADLAIVELLLAGKTDLNGSDALQTAAEKGQVDLVRLLLEKGAAIDAVGFEDSVSESKADEAGTALRFAVDAGSVEVARLLLEKGADVRLRDVKGRTARERAEEKRMEGVVQFLNSL